MKTNILPRDEGMTTDADQEKKKTRKKAKRRLRLYLGYRLPDS